MSYFKEIALYSFQELVYKRSGLNIDSFKMLKADASDRKIFRINYGSHTCIGIYNENPKENLAFVKFSGTFLKLGLNVPEILGFSEDNLFYIEEDLGDLTLHTAVSENKTVNRLTLYKNALSDLLKFQILSKEEIDYSYCYQTKEFNEFVLRYDIEKFRDYFLKKYFAIPDSDSGLEEITLICRDLISKSNNNYFLYRDFQPRNIMIKNNELYYIDYQSGRKGPLQYDLASFLYSGSSELTKEERLSLMMHYMDKLRDYVNYEEMKFREDFYYFVFIRLLQVLGSYAYVYEKKKDMKMIDKIKRGLIKLGELKENIENKKIIKFINNINSQSFEFIHI